MRVRPFKKRRLASNTDEDLAENPVGSRARGLELDLRLREFEISQLTQRNNFLMIFQGVLVAGLVQSQGTAAPILTFGMSLLGIASSILQIGMAGGAKFWQSRWEASTRSSEIAIVLALLKRNRLAVQTFTHDSALLTDEEQKQIREWNQSHSDPADQIIDDPTHIDSVVRADVGAGAPGMRRTLDWWVRTWAIQPKWSVSRIPIWMGAALLLFWLIIAFQCVHVPWIKTLGPWPIELVPLKAESR